MNRIFLGALILPLIAHQSIHAASIEYGATLCNTPGYVCKKIKSKDSWSSLFPDQAQRNLIRQLNRMNGFLRAGMVMALPLDLNHATQDSLSPFPLKNTNIHENTIIIDQDKQAWGAYSAQGDLIRWGAASSGSKKCFESPNGCLTPAGTFQIFRKHGKDCFSSSLPKRVNGRAGGAYMPYCMFFREGYAIHGSDTLPGYPDSHGCVRIFVEDAKWLYDVFTETRSKNKKGTRVIVYPFKT